MIDPETQSKALRRLGIIKGQVAGLEKMVREQKYCLDVLTQISAIHEALRGVGKVVVENHLRTCVTDGLKQDRQREAEKHYKELMDIVYRLSK